jgi:hypothetical protein
MAGSYVSHSPSNVACMQIMRCLEQASEGIHDISNGVMCGYPPNGQ